MSSVITIHDKDTWNYIPELRVAIKSCCKPLVDRELAEEEVDNILEVYSKMNNVWVIKNETKDGKVKGIACCMIVPDSSMTRVSMREIFVYVFEGYRGTKTVRELVTALEEHTKQQGLTSVTIGTIIRDSNKDLAISYGNYLTNMGYKISDFSFTKEINS